jgi:hypothetical protein
LIGSLTIQVALMLGLMAIAMIAAGLFIGELTRSYAVGFWGRRAEDRGAKPARAVVYRGPERRQREPIWIDTMV